MPHLQWTYAMVWFLLFFQPRADINLLSLLDSLPLCAQNCLTRYETQISQSGCTTVQCFCSDSSLISTVAKCVDQCSSSDQQLTFQILHPYCPSLPDPFAAATSSTFTTFTTSTIVTSTTISTTPTILTAPTIVTTPVISTNPTISTAPTILTTPTIFTTPMISTTPTAAGSTFTSPITQSNSTTSAFPIFTGAATLPVANLAMVGMGLVGAFHALF